MGTRSPSSRSQVQVQAAEALLAEALRRRGAGEEPPEEVPALGRPFKGNYRVFVTDI